MFTIRKNVFETNSSSTHSICISKSKPVERNTITLTRKEYGWEHSEYDLADYFYTAVCLFDREEELLKILRAMGITATITNNTSKEYDDYYIDHYDGLSDLVDEALNDVDLLLRILFSEDGVVYTGNDNDDLVHGFWDRDKKIIEDEWGFSYANPHYNPKADDYEWFYKGN